MLAPILGWFRPPPVAPRRSDAEIKALYPRMRWQVFESAFVAYAAFYVVRNNFAPVSKELGSALHYSKDMIGNILAITAITYGLGKFIMGYFSDRSDPRKYLFAGMSLTAALNFAFGASISYGMHLFLWGLNGFVQGMGYGPCSRGLSHWYSKKERGFIFAFWCTSHNVGGAIAGIVAAKCAQSYGWPSAFFVPGVIASVCAVYLLWRMCDSPQSVGLPSVEEYKNDGSIEQIAHHERELTSRELWGQYILPNKMLWIIAIANFFVYIARYSMVDWGPTYLKEVKGASIMQGGSSTAIIELAGAGGMLMMGWISDKLGGRRAMVCFFALIPVVLAFLGILITPKGMLWLDLSLFGVIGFFIYGPVVMLAVISLDLTSKKAVGTATGFVGLFGYLGRVVQGKGLGWVVDRYPDCGWNAGLWSIVICTGLAVLLLSLAWNVRPKG